MNKLACGIAWNTYVAFAWQRLIEKKRSGFEMTIFEEEHDLILNCMKF